VILYRKTPQLRVRRFAAPEPPFWAATTVSPYSSRRSTPIAIDYLTMRATAGERLDVSVCERVELPSRIESPVFIEATGNVETVFRRGEEIANLAGDSVLLSDVVPTSLPAQATLALTTPDPSASKYRWGLVIPVMYPATTNLELLRNLVRSAKTDGASFVAAMSIELDATAKHALGTDDETYEMLFHADLEPIHTATERHIAALAAEHGLADFVIPPNWNQRSNWNAAIVLTLAASRMIAMDYEPELAGTLARSARVVAELDKSIERIAEAASLSIVEALDEVSVDILTEWVESGSAAFVRKIDELWRLRRDHGV